MNTTEKFKLEIEKLQRQLKIKSALRVLAVSLNAIGGIILGVGLREIAQDDFEADFIWCTTLIFLSIVYLYLNFWIFYSDSSDKIEFLDRLKFKDELQKQNDLNEILIQGLNKVNLQTCKTYTCSDPCDEATFMQRLTDIIAPLKNLIKKEFQTEVSIGIQMNKFRKVIDGEIQEEVKLFKLIDELGINSEIPENLLVGDLKEKQGFNRFMFTHLTNIIFNTDGIIMIQELNDDSLLSPSAIKHNFATIFSLIPDLCDEKLPHCKGGLYIITNSESFPDVDLLAFFELYGWFIGSYIDQYNQCVEGRKKRNLT